MTNTTFENYTGTGAEFGWVSPIKQANLDNGGELYIFIDTKDGWIEAELIYRDPNNKLWSSNDQHGANRIADVFPREYWYAGLEQHEAYAEAIHAYFEEENIDEYSMENYSQIKHDIAEYCGDYADDYDLDQVVADITIQYYTASPWRSYPKIVTMNDLLDDALQANEIN
ncbi:hypothetical protein [Leucobacter sp. OH1287]|uniref:hypothetical protein n=1 Tax=Leucobacter sp. OH1287 TaxID=2491049 RepID=UPI000F5D5339|nr:hypothetical protein [Leucobacter sp. OH1287]RRD61616.1 hypothetical protein EII30_01970 [Leucobacter sp. OH1287]